METILEQIEEEIARLQNAADILRGTRKPKNVISIRYGKKKLSIAGRRRISEAMKKRWAERKRAAKAA